MQVSHFPIRLFTEDTPDGKQLIVEVPIGAGEAPFEFRLAEDQALTFAKLITKEFRAPAAKAAPVDTEGFVQFWSAYPSHRRVDRAGCLRKWQAMGLDAVAQKVFADVSARAESHDWTKDRGQYVPMAATYLNQRRWEASEGPSEASMQSV